jgi:flavin reductase (DIM6/NTAB) family NADH-FMN oxidoreductase RutF
MDELAQRTRDALRRLAKSVAIVTLSWNGARYAMAATAVEGLSLDPPSMLLCLQKSASIAAPLLERTPFAINLLAAAQAEMVARCSAPFTGEERFGLGRWSAHAGSGPPLLKGAQASFVCAPDSITSYGTHHIVIGRIEHVQLDGGFDPLVYADAACHRLTSI